MTIFKRKWLTENELKQGKAIAKSVGASGFGECSARTGENVAEVFKAIVNFVVANVKENERKMQQSKREEKVNDAVRDTKRGFKRIGNKLCQIGLKFRNNFNTTTPLMAPPKMD